MKVVDNHRNKTKVRGLKLGDVFLTSSGFLYLRVAVPSTIELPGNHIPVVMLPGSGFGWVHEDTEVEKVEATITIE